MLYCCKNIVKKNYIINIICLLGLILLLIPLFVDKNSYLSNYNERLDREVFDCYFGRNSEHIHDGKEKYHFAAINIMLTIPLALVLSVIWNIIFDHIQLKKLCMESIGYINMLIFERYILCIFQVLPSLVSFIFILCKSYYTGLFFTQFYRMFGLMLCYICILILRRSKFNIIWNDNVLLIKLLLYVVVSNTIYYCVNFKEYTYIITIFFSSYLIFSCYYTILYCKKLKIYYSSLPEINKHNELLCFSILIIEIVTIVCQIIIFFVNGGRLIDNSNMKMWITVCIIKNVQFLIIITIYNRIVGTRLMSSTERVNSLENFIRQLSHEIRTPLNVLQMGLDDLNQKYDLCSCVSLEIKNGIKSTVNDSIESVDVVVGILNDILQIDKLTSGCQVYELIPVSLGKFIKTTSNLFRFKAVFKEINFDYSISDIDDIINTVINIDPIKMATVLRNLISNSLKFTKKNGNIKIDIKKFIKMNTTINQIVPESNYDIEIGNPNFVRIEVIDDGIGISEENIHKLLNKPLQIEANKNQGGDDSGFGLLISKKIIEDHGGRIRIKSDGLEKGSTFIVEIPIMNIEDMDNIMREKYDKFMNNDTDDKVSNRNIILRNSIPNQLIKNSVECKEINELIIDRSKSKILIVDDSKPSLKMLGKLLESLNLNFITAENGRESVEIIKNDNDISIILMDNNMPIMKGEDATKEIRDLGYTKPILGVTGALCDIDIQSFIEKGANEIIPKPLKRDKLNEILIKYGII